MTRDLDPADTDRDWQYLDDATSAATVAVILLCVLTVVAGSVYAVASGAVGNDISVSGDITVTGTIPVGWLVGAAVGAVGVWLYTTLSDIYGARRVDRGIDQLQETRDDE